MSDQMYFKVLSPQGNSIHGGNLQWSLPTQKADGTWKPGKWHKVSGNIAVCSNGLHLTTEPFQWYTKDCVCYAAEGKGIHDSEGNKTAFAQARLLYPVPHPQWWLDALAFVASIPDTPFMNPDGNPKLEWKLFTAPTLKEARAAAGDAARAAAWDAALYTQVINICTDLKLDDKHIEHAKARWEIRQKGYCLLCDVDGVLYVYAKEN